MRDRRFSLSYNDVQDVFNLTLCRPGFLCQRLEGTQRLRPTTVPRNTHTHTHTHKRISNFHMYNIQFWTPQQLFRKVAIFVFDLFSYANCLVGPE